MKNEHYILGTLPLHGPIDEEILNRTDKDVLMASIRNGAHILDLIMQMHRGTIAASSSQRLEAHRTKMSFYKSRFGDNQPDFKWAAQVGDLFDDYIRSNGLFIYPYEAIEKTNIPESEFDKLVTRRRSVRDFDGEADDEQIRKIIYYAQWAPTNCGLQALRFVVIKDMETRKQLRNCGNHSTICVVADLRVYPDNDIDCPYHDSGAAIQNMLIASHYYGLGACYVSDLGVNSEKNRELLHAANFEKITAIVWVGLCRNAPIAPVRRCIDEIIQWI